MSPWIQHVKKFAKSKGMKYNEALKRDTLLLGSFRVGFFLGLVQRPYVQLSSPGRQKG